MSVNVGNYGSLLRKLLLRTIWGIAWFFPAHLPAQSLLKCDKVDFPDVCCEYFLRIDSLFAVNHRISACIVEEESEDLGRISNPRTVMHYQFAPNGKRTYTEIIHWVDSIRRHVWKTELRGDTQLATYTWVGLQQANGAYKTMIQEEVHALIRVNDTLTRHSEWKIANQKRISEKEWESVEAPKRSIPDTLVTPQSFTSVGQPNAAKIALFPDVSDFELYQPQPDQVSLDSFQRIVEIKSFQVTTVAEKMASFPHRTKTIEYVDTGRTIQAYRVYQTMDEAYFTKQIKSGKQTSWYHQWPAGEEKRSIFYEMIATNFIYGVPQLVVVSNGKGRFIHRFKLKLQYHQ